MLVVLFFLIKKQINKPTPVDAFAISDTSLVKKIELTHLNDTLLLIRTEKGWYLNNKQKVKIKNIERLLFTLKNIEIKAPLSEIESDKHTDIIKREGTYVTISADNSVLKHYIFYENVTDQINSFILDQESNHLYMVKISGYYSKIMNNFSINVSYWRSNSLLDIKGFEIESVKVEYPQNKQNSYIVKCDSLNSYFLYNLKNESLYCNSSQIEKYFSYFQNISFIQNYDNPDIFNMDTLYHYANIDIRLINGNYYKFSFYKIKKQNIRNNSEYDFNYLYIKNLKENKFYKLRYIDIDLLLKDILYFK